MEANPMTRRNTSLAATAAALAALSAAPVPAADEAPRGLYVGGAITQSRFDDSTFRVADFDDEDTSWKAIAGIRFHPSFSIEANYVDFGEASAPGGPLVSPFTVEAKAFSLFAVGYVPVPWVDLFAKVGAARIDAEGGAAPVFFEDDATEFAYGGGVQARIGNFAIRAEYEKFDTDIVGDLDLISVGATWTFGPRE